MKLNLDGGMGIAKGMALTLEHFFRKPITTQYPDERLTVSRRIRGNSLAWHQARCTGCYTCSRSCPHDCITIETPEEGIKGPALAPCTQTCPCNVDAARYVRLIAEGKFAEALAVVREKIPFPCVCGYICAHPCEGKCNRGVIDEPIAIRILKRFAWEHDTGIWRANSKIAPPTGKRVAVIGAGPAGLSAAYYLTKRGHKVTIFEALPEAGGMMRYGIPEYRLPKALLRKEIKEIEDVGVEIKTNTPVASLDNLLAEGYNAVFVGVGAQVATGIGVDGEKGNPRVMGGVVFLREANMGKRVNLGDRVAVIGGGNTAMDSARTALRLGAKDVTIVYRRTRAEMPAAPEEIEEALHEGIKMLFLAAPSRVINTDGAIQLECQRMKLGAPDASGRRRPEPIKGSEFITTYDTIIAAIGQRVEVPATFGIAMAKGNVIQVGKTNPVTDKPGIYAGGDAVTGPATVVEAISAGRRAATAIDQYLGGSGAIDEKLAPDMDVLPRQGGGPLEAFRPEIPAISKEKRVTTFEGVELSLEEKLAVAEAKRCLRCDCSYPPTKWQLDARKCIFCGLCVESCPFDALFMGYTYERGSYRNRDLILQKEDLLFEEKIKPSGYAHKEIESTLPKQSLLIERDKKK